LVIAVLAVGALVTAGLGLLSAGLNRSNEHHLLGLRGKEVASALTAALPETETPLGAAAAIGDATGGDPAKFMSFAASEIGAGRPFISLSLWRAQHITAGPVVVAGVAPRLQPTSPDARRFFATAAIRTGLTVMGFLQGPAPRIGYAYSGSKSNAFVAYGEAGLPPRRFIRLPSGSAYSNLNVALYLGKTTNPSQLLFATVHRLPLPGHQDRSSIAFGNTFLTVVVSPSQPLGGTFPLAVVWGIVIAGTLLTLAAAFLTARLIAGRRRAQGLAEENRRLFAEQRTIAVTLQRALLPDVLPRIPGVEVAARYDAGVSGIEVGGDWYDVLVLDEQRLLMVVGDVSGRGLRAATTMASLRFAIRYAAQVSSPDVFLPRLSAEHQLSRDGQLATVLCALVDFHAREVSVTSAGHLPLLMIDGDRCTFLETEVGLPVGVDRQARYVSRTYPVPPAATLLGFTDGLVERRGEALDDGLERLRRAAAAGHGTLDEMIAQVLDSVRAEDSFDDTAIAGIRWSS
jgi:hypothetical protein